MIFDLQDESISLPLFQYLVSIAIIQAVCTDNTNDAIDLRIKWPNDIYCKGVKVGGILINSESMDKKVRLYIGVGTNIDHVPFAGSINQLIGESATHPRVLREEFLAKFCIRLEKLWNTGDARGISHSAFTTNCGCIRIRMYGLSRNRQSIQLRT